jgi:hypothetical protein
LDAGEVAGAEFVAGDAAEVEAGAGEVVVEVVVEVVEVEFVLEVPPDEQAMTGSNRAARPTISALPFISRTFILISFRG